MTPAPLSPTICALPWTHRCVSERGRIYPCAFSMESGHALKDERGRYYGPQELERAWNSPQLREIRREMLSGRQPASCSRCFRLEKLGLQSLRSVANRSWEDGLNAVVSLTAGDGSAAPAWSSLDLRLGNFCNLRCRMCSPESTQKIAAEFRSLHPELQDSYFHELENMDWFRSPAVSEALLSHAAELRELHFAGGEPFLIPEVRAYLAKLVENGHSREITLTFNTNLTSLPEAVTDFWPHFRAVKVFVSLDGAREVNEYIRFPSNFSKIEANLRALDEGLSRFGSILVCFHTTVQMYNILSLDKLIEFTTTSFRNFLPFPILSPLHWPEYFAPTVLPPDLKALAIERLENATKKGAGWTALESRCDYSDGAARFRRAVEGIARLIRDEDHSALLGEFVKATAFFDRSREQDIRAVVPEFAGLFR